MPAVEGKYTMNTQIGSVANKLKKIREAYLKQVPAQLEAIRSGYDDFIQTNSGAGSELEILHRRVHTMKGSSASFGLSKLSAAADAAELLLKEAMQLTRAPKETWHELWRESFTRIEEEVAQLDQSAYVDLRAVELVVTGEKTREGEQKVVYICDDDTFQRLTLTTQIECFGFRVISFGDLEQLHRAVKNAPPDVIVMDLIFPDRPTGGAETIENMRSESGEKIPVVFISSSSRFESRLSAVRAGANAYFTKPLNVAELCATLSKLTADERPDPYRVLIVDDDQHLAELYSMILEGSGMVTMTVNNPLEVMEPLVEFKPDLILTDMYMPGCNGMELASTIRQIGHAFSIPIIFLSSETDIGKQFQAMRTGGDEFLTKLVEPENLIAAVAGRAERMKIIRSFMVRDSMTGLYNHTATKEHLEVTVAKAERNGTDLCFAMIDVDRFKQVNDNYGHAMGDQVLIALARLLGQRVRKSDIVGRYGGEEFAVVLPDCDIVQAELLLNRLRESFSALHFPVGSEFFSCSFSCGVASLSGFKNQEQLCKAADSALYQAKENGRNQVVAATGQN